MSTIFAHGAMLPMAFSEDISIISRREIEPLLVKAQQIFMFYNEAMDCSAAVLDKNGSAIKTLKIKNQMRFCEFCKNYLNDPFLMQKNSEAGEGHKCFCKRVHHEAQAESRRINETYIYTCYVGFVYWTSPLYRNGRYAGALTAGQVLSGKPEAALEKFCAVCKDRFAVEKFRKLLEGVPQKSHLEIQAMARLLGVCAGEISEKGEDPGKMIRRITWQEDQPGNMRELKRFKSRMNQPSQPDNFSLPFRPANLTPPPAGDQAERSDKGVEAAEYPLEKERMLLAAFRRGDNETGGRILNELMNSIRSAIPLNLEIFRLRVIELVVLLSRAATVPEDSDNNAMFDANNRYLRRILESRTSEELIDNLHLVAQRMAGKIFSFKGVRHAAVLRRAERYIWENYSRKISLDEIAKASGLSAPYFSTIFKEEMGENLSSYLNRLRIEKAAAMLTETGKSLNEIAGLCGFEDQSWFSKIFKIYTGMSPGKYRETGNGSLEFRQKKSRQKEKIIFPDLTASKQNKEDLLSS